MKIKTKSGSVAFFEAADDLDIDDEGWSAFLEGVRKGVRDEVLHVGRKLGMLPTDQIHVFFRVPPDWVPRGGEETNVKPGGVAVCKVPISRRMPRELRNEIADDLVQRLQALAILQLELVDGRMSLEGQTFLLLHHGRRVEVAANVASIQVDVDALRILNAKSEEPIEVDEWTSFEERVDLAQALTGTGGDA